MTILEELGFDPFFATQLTMLGDETELVPARVTADSGDLFELSGCQAPLGSLSGRLRHELPRGERPTTGDWVAVEDGAEHGIIHVVFDRKTVLRRRAAGSESRPQIVAANVDVFFVVTSANRDLNQRRIERYLTAVWDSGARPVVVLNKVDLVNSIDSMIQSIQEVALAVPVAGVSAHTGDGVAQLKQFIEPCLTVGFIGSSGVGKSTLINRLLGQEERATDGLRTDGKGRHKTTRRELVLMSEGGVLIDTPGMRELGIVADETGLDTTFADVASFAEHCRYRDCRHETEPHCAVRAAADSGELAPDRLASFLRLQKEIESAEARKEPAMAANTKRRWKAIKKNYRAFTKSRRQGDK